MKYLKEYKEYRKEQLGLGEKPLNYVDFVNHRFLLVKELSGDVKVKEYKGRTYYVSEIN